MKSTFFFSLLCTGISFAGDFSPGAGQAGSDAIAFDSSAITAWATGATLERGRELITDPTSPFASYGENDAPLGPVTADNTDPAQIVSLGDGGSATLTFANPIANGPGPDFAVFENGFEDIIGDFLELAVVEVSSNGIDFFRFPAISQTPSTNQVGTFGTLDATDLHNLAGKYVAGFGVPFDLDDLHDISPLLFVDHITHVRVIDVVGSIDPNVATFDATGNPINDPFPTACGSNCPGDSSTSGFDLAGVGVLHTAPTSFAEWQLLKFPGLINHLPTQDPDGDGLTNIEEYALLTEPQIPNGCAVAGDMVNGQLQVTFRRSSQRNDVTISVQRSTELSAWSAAPLGNAGDIITLESIDLVSTPALTREFVRLYITIP